MRLAQRLIELRKTNYLSASGVVERREGKSVQPRRRSHCGYLIKAAVALSGCENWGLMHELLTILDTQCAEGLLAKGGQNCPQIFFKLVCYSITSYAMHIYAE